MGPLKDIGNPHRHYWAIDKHRESLPCIEIRMMFMFRKLLIALVIPLCFLFSGKSTLLAQPSIESKIESLVRERKFKEAIPTLENLTRIDTKAPTSESFEWWSLLAYSYVSVRELDKAQYALDFLIQHKPELNDRQLSDSYFTQALVWFEKARYYEAIQNIEYANEKCALSFGKATWQYARILWLTGMIYRQGFFNNDLALKYLLEGLGSLRSDSHPYYEACLNYQLAIVYYGKHDFEKLEYYNFKAQEFFDTQPAWYAADRARCYNISAIKTYFTGTLQQALNEYERGLSCLRTYNVEPHLAGRFYDNMGVFCWKQDPALAISYFKKSLSINRQYPHNDYWISNNLLNLGSLLEADQKTAMEYLKEALAIRKKIFGEKHPEVGMLYSHLAQHYAVENKLDSAIHYYDVALENLTQLKNVQVIYLASLASFSAKRARLMRKEFDASKDLSVLLAGFRGLQVADSILQAARKSLDWEVSQISLTQETRVLYDLFIDFAHSIHTITGDEQYADLAFRAMEQVKYGSLLESLQQSSRFDRRTEQIRKRLRGKIMECQLLLSAFDKKGDEAKVRELRNKFVVLSDSLVGISQNIKEQQHFSEIQLTLNDVKTQVVLVKNHVIEYYEGDSAYFAISLKPGKTEFVKIMRTQGLKKIIRDFMAMCSHKPSLSATEAAAFARASNQLYRTLVAPVRTNSAREDMIIVPDGELSLIPFDALVVEIEKSDTGFSKLSYLGRHAALRSAFTLQILEDQKSQVILSAQARAAVYSDTGIGNTLAGAIQEIDILKKYFAAESFKSKPSFQSHASDYNIHHFALHGNYDSTDRNKSGIV
jgi:CHAT domain-containing protein